MTCSFKYWANLMQISEANHLDFTKPLLNLTLNLVFWKDHMAWYVVFRGRVPGVYSSWAMANA
jgi:hypothetical protein